ncbi:hypothetical protein D9M71_498260 [compost metagenome]
MGGQQREVMRLAEERSQIGGQRIGERLPLPRAGLARETLEVLTEITHAVQA